MDKTELILNAIMVLAIGYFLAVIIVLFTADTSVCTKAGYDAVSITPTLTLTCVHEVVVPYNEVARDFEET